MATPSRTYGDPSLSRIVARVATLVRANLQILGVALVGGVLGALPLVGDPQDRVFGGSEGGEPPDARQ